MIAKGHGERLSRLQERAVAALLTHSTVKAAAAACGVNEKTLRRWLQEPVFAAAYRRERRGLVDGAVARLQRSAVAAAKALRRNLTCGKPGDEIKAADLILTHAIKGAELMDMLARVEQLEALMAKRKDR